MNSQTEYVNLSVSDGTSMRAYVAHPEGKPRAGLLVFQEAFGVNAHIRDVTERFAREGYLSISPELFHRTAPGLEAGYTNFPEVMPHLQALTDAGLAGRYPGCVSVAEEWRGQGSSGWSHWILHGRTDFDSCRRLPSRCNARCPIMAAASARARCSRA